MPLSLNFTASFTNNPSLAVLSVESITAILASGLDSRIKFLAVHALLYEPLNLVVMVIQIIGIPSSTNGWNLSK